MNIDTTALDALFDANPDTAKGIAAAYQVLLVGVPTQAGFTFLINNAAMTNFGAGPGSMFNAENIYINLANSLVLGNPTAAANFASISTGATLADKITSLYNTLIPFENRTSEGLAYLIRTEALDFYRSVATERGMTGDAGAAIVAMASILQIAVRMDIGVGADVNDLIAAVNEGSSQLPADGGDLTHIDVADGTNFDSVVVEPTPDAEPAPTPAPITPFTANKAGFNTGNTSDSNEAIVTSSADNTIIAPDNFLTGATVNGAGGNDTLLVTTTATVGGLGAVAGGTITGVDIINLQAGGVVDLANVDSDLNTINASAASTVTTDANNADVILNGSGGVDTLVIGGTDFTGTFTGGGGTDVISSAGGDINNAAIDVETLSLIGSADVLLTAAQHTAFSNINAADGNDTLRFFDAFTGTGDADVANYNLAGALNSNFTLGAAGQNVLESGGTNTINLGSLTATGNLTGFDGDDTAVVTTGGDITGVNSGNAIGARILNLSGLATMTERQHNGFDIINATTQNDQINIAGGNLGIIITHADVESYSLGDDIGNNVFVEVRGAAQTVTTASADDLVGFGFVGTLTTFTGSLTGGGTADDSLGIEPGTDISGGTLNSIENLGTIGSGTCTFTNAQISGFTDILAIGVNTAVITDAATITIDDAGALQRDDFENFTFNSQANVTVQMENADATVNTINLETGGAGGDVVRLSNQTTVASANDHVIINNFNIGADDLFIQADGVAQSVFETVGAGSNTDIADINNDIIEIDGANTISAATATDTANGGAVETAILSAIGTVGASTVNQDGVFILYGDGNAFLYSAEIISDPNGGALVATDFEVELIAQINSVALGSLANFDFT